MRVSVVIPTYNRRELVARAIASVVDQTYDDLEIVVVDDGSTDGTVEMLEELASCTPRALAFVWQQNAGCASARNRGLALATGEAITFLDADDRLTPTAAESLVTELADSGADFVYSPAIEVHADGAEYLNPPVAAGQPERFSVLHFMNTNVRNGAFMFKRSVLDQVAGLDETLHYNEDSDFVQRVSVWHRGAYTPTPTVRVYHHDENKSRDRAEVTKALLASSERVLKEAPAFAERLGDAAAIRIRRLEEAHVLELMKTGRFDAAADFVGRRNLTMPYAMRLALRLRSMIPIHVGKVLRRLRIRRAPAAGPER